MVKIRKSLQSFIVLAILSVFTSGCQEENKKTVSDLQFNMQLYQVQEISTKPLVPVAAEKGRTADIVQYRGWFYDGTEKVTLAAALKPRLLIKESKPYLLTFELYPPVTKEQCSFLAKKEGISDPNGVAEIMALEGHRPSRLAKIQIDEATLLKQAFDKQAKAIRNHASQDQQQLQQIDWQLNQIKHDMDFQKMQRGW